jgi:hypothetical protein
VRDRIHLAIVERIHVGFQEIRIEVAVDLVNVAVFDRKHDRRLHVRFERQQNIAAVDDDGAARRLFIRPGAYELLKRLPALYPRDVVVDCIQATLGNRTVLYHLWITIFP